MKCLVIMPFAHDFDGVFAAAKAAVAKSLPTENVECFWLKDQLAAGRITDDILHGLTNSAFCIADLSGNNPNVMWETGYAMALGKPTILIGQSVEALPFDLKVHRVLAYSPSDLGLLTQQLAEAVRQTLSRYELHTKIDQAIRPLSRSHVIAVTGTMNADVNKSRRRIETLLSPYLDKKTTWYCGSNGVTDELILDYLVSHGELAISVGYNRYDFSAKIRALIEKKLVEAVDASVEALPRGLSGPSARDVIFASKSDLVVLFWDGKSRGTKTLIDFFKANNVNTLIGFI